MLDSLEADKKRLIASLTMYQKIMRYYHEHQTYPANICEFILERIDVAMQQFALSPIDTKEDYRLFRDVIALLEYYKIIPSHQAEYERQRDRAIY